MTRQEWIAEGERCQRKAEEQTDETLREMYERKASACFNNSAYGTVAPAETDESR